MTVKAAEALAQALRELERMQQRVFELETFAAQLTLDNQQLELRLRVVDLMEQESARRLGIAQPPLRSVPDEHSVRAGDAA